MTLKLLPAGSGKTLSDHEKLLTIRAEITSALDAKFRVLQSKTSALRATTEAALWRIEAQGIEATLDDLRTGGWYQTVSEIRMLQEVQSLLDSME